jgi:hypothetical protein
MLQVRIFKNTWFQKFARKENISDRALCDAVDRAEKGLIDADLGSGLIKQRVARPGAGKSGGYRTVIFFRSGTRALFAYGFAKNDRSNLDADEETAYRKAAKLVLGFSEKEVDAAVAAGRLVEVKCDGKELQERGPGSRPRDDGGLPRNRRDR